MFNTNPVVNIFFHTDEKEKHDERAFTLYNLCIYMDGIIDRLRWDLVRAVSKKQPAVLRDVKIADLFQSIPDNAYRTDYVNFLLTCFMAQQDTEKVMNSFSNLNERQLVPSKKAMWEYINFCNNRNVWNSTVASYCQKLIESGWVNSYLSQTAVQLKDKGIIDPGNRIFRILSLYGYYDA